MSLDFNRRHALFGATSLAFLSGATPVWGHRLTTTETRVDINSQTGRVEVAHTFHVHDTEETLAKAGIIEKADLASLRQRAKLALYVEENFKINQNGTPVALNIVGAELDKRNVLTFQEGELSLPIGELSVRASMMRELVHNQINNVDVYIDKAVTSLQFRGTDGSKKILA
jgi:hypothetical protein